MAECFQIKRLTAACLLVVGLVCPASSLLAQPKAGESALPKEDVEVLEGMFKDFLFDPSGATFVEVKTWKLPDKAFGGVGVHATHGWLVPAQGAEPERLHLIDGDVVVSPPKEAYREGDHVKFYREYYSPSPGALPQLDVRSPLLHAAWFYRIGQNSLATEALELAQTGRKLSDAVAELRKELARNSYLRCIEAFKTRSDALAKTRVERLLKVFAQEVPTLCPQATVIQSELARREKQGVFGKEPNEQWPEGFDKWEDDRKLKFLIGQLEEVKRPFTDPPDARFRHDPTVQAIVALGDKAVPSLLDVMEKDDRLSHSESDEFRDRTCVMIEVRELAYVALSSILGVDLFKSASRDDSLSRRSTADQQKLVAQLRAYWKENGAISYEERLMSILTNPKSEFKSVRDAARKLAFSEYRAMPTPQFARTDIGTLIKYRTNQALRKIQKPTVAEAILFAMDRDLTTTKPVPNSTAGPSLKQGELFNKLRTDEARDLIECTYIQALIGLGDRRMGKEAVRRYETAKSARMRRHWAMAAHAVGQAGPLREIAGEFEAGKVTIVPAAAHLKDWQEQADFYELGSLVRDLSLANTPETDRAVSRLADPEYPLHQVAMKAVLYADMDKWGHHPYCLPLLVKQLSDRSRSEDPDRHLDLVCDLAASRLIRGVWSAFSGSKHSDANLLKLQAAIESAPGGYRLLTPREKWAVCSYLSRLPVFVPNIQLLDRAATAEDVKQGRAIFSLDGKGTLAKLKLPASATVKGEKSPIQGLDSVKVLIMQAEYDENQNLILGVIKMGGIQRMSEDELFDIVPIDSPPQPVK